MKTITINLSDSMEKILQEYVAAGPFTSTEEVLKTATVEFVRRHRIDLSEKFALEDIEWAFRNRKVD